MPSPNRVARMTGLFYLGVAVSGLFGFLLIRPRLFVADDPSATLANLLEHESLARAGIAFELLLVLTQVLTAAWFYRLFHRADRFAAAGIAGFGFAGAVTLLASAAMLATALQTALDPVGDAANDVALLYRVSENLWGVGGLFSGLWLIPMGWAVLSSGWMPRPLGWILIGGGIGYVLAPFLRYGVPGGETVSDALAFPATVGEFWIIGYLLILGVRRRAVEATPTSASERAPQAA